MQPVQKVSLCAVGAVVASLLTACGSGNNTVTPANIRLANASSVTLNFSLNGTYDIPDVAAATASAYVQVPPGTYNSSVYSPTLTAGTGYPFSIATGQSYTTIGYVRDNLTNGALHVDNMAVPTSGFANIDVENISIDAGSLNVYLLSQGQSPTSSYTANFSSVQLGQSYPSSFVEGTYDVWVTGSGGVSDIRAVAKSITFNSTQPYTLALTSTPGGVLVDMTVVPQGGGIVGSTTPNPTFHASTFARVRVLSALPFSTSANPAVVQANITEASGTVVALPQDFSPNPTSYQLVTASTSSSATTTVSSIVVTDPNTSTSVTVVPTNASTTPIASGNDYTILLYGTNAAPVALILTDNNQVIANEASVRLINAAISSTTVDMNVEGSFPYATGIAYGATTTYAGVSPGTNLTLQVLGGSYDQTLTGQTLKTDAVYTVLVYNASDPPLLINDR